MEFTPEELNSLVRGFTSKLEEQNKRMDALEKMLYEDFLGPAEENFKAWDHSTRLGEFTEKYQDQLGPLVDKCKKIENDENFDLFDKVFSDYDSMEEKGDEGEYVASVVAGLTNQIEALKSVLGAEDVTIENTGDETKVVADGEEVAQSETLDETIESEKADETQESVDETTIKNETEEDNSEDEIDSFVKELENSKEFKNRRL